MDGIGLTLAGVMLVAPPLTVLAVRGPVAPDRPLRLAHPGLWLALVVAACLVNQVLCTVYLIRVHGGDPSFIADRLPAGWFALADDNRAVRALADVFPAPRLLAPTVLRVQAVLELPFVLLAYLLVVRMWDRRLYRALTGRPVLIAAAVTWTVTFGVIEWSLPNPYTLQDVVLRLISCVVTVPLLARLGRATPAPEPVERDAVDLVLFGVSAAALGWLVLAVYDTLLLYNLGHAAAQLPGCLVAGIVLGLARFVAVRRTSPAAPGPGIDTLGTGLGWFLALFFAPALTIRYALGLDGRLFALAAALLIVVATIVLTFLEVDARLPRPLRAAWLGQVVGAGIAGVGAAVLARLASAAYPEVKLLLAAGFLLAAVTVVCAATDPVLRRLSVR
ncbi:hypothetical protein ACIA8K_23390 [Catenuloplanes sp. NPDC051500]|uniref:hypothetical protein n=1 Tax=Catenuloplanes sp. NPDC051500 TaxID=3363959 RepID=UPI0037A76A6A